MTLYMCQAHLSFLYILLLLLIITLSRSLCIHFGGGRTPEFKKKQQNYLSICVYCVENGEWNGKFCIFDDELESVFDKVPI